MKISMLIPSRHRMPMLIDNINKNNKLAKNKDNIEWLIRLDNDDEESKQYFLDNKPENAYITIGERFRGYIDLHLMVNELCNIANGDILWLWNDDVSFRNPGWDEITVNTFNNAGVFVCQLQSGTQFPAISFAIFEALGHFSICCANDSYIEYVTKGLDITAKLPLLIDHKQFDNDDDTWHEGCEVKKQQNKEFWSSEFQAKIEENKQKIKEFLKNNGKL